VYLGFEIDGMVSSTPGSFTELAVIAKQTVIPGALDLLTELKKAGHHIVLYTHRDASTAIETEKWLSKNKVPYDRIMFNRPHNVVLFFSQDARKFNGWDGVREELVGHGILKERHEDTTGAKDRGAHQEDSQAGHQGSEDVVEKPSGTDAQGPPSGGTRQTLK
jgi:hypothetical protein